MDISLHSDQMIFFVLKTVLIACIEYAKRQICLKKEEKEPQKYSLELAINTINSSKVKQKHPPKGKFSSMSG